MSRKLTCMLFFVDIKEGVPTRSKIRPIMRTTSTILIRERVLEIVVGWRSERFYATDGLVLVRAFRPTKVL